MKLDYFQRNESLWGPNKSSAAGTAPVLPMKLCGLPDTIKFHLVPHQWENTQYTSQIFSIRDFKFQIEFHQKTSQCTSACMATLTQEDVNGEKLTMKKWWISGADFSRFTQTFLRFIRNINGEKKTSRY